jgi:hypothetical protein
MRFLKTYIADEFSKTVHDHPEFKIVVIDGSVNDLPMEYAISKFPTIYFVHKENEAYVPIKWKTEDYKLGEMREWLYEHSLVFH